MELPYGCGEVRARREEIGCLVKSLGHFERGVLEAFW